MAEMKAACRTLCPTRRSSCFVFFRLPPEVETEADFYLFLITLDALFKESGEAGHIFIISVGA